MVEIKDRLQQALAVRNITRSELSKLSGVPKPMITDYLKGRYKPKQDKIHALCKALRVNPAWFMGYEDADMNDLSYLDQPATPEQQLLDLFRQLNTEGQREAVKLVGMLVQTGSYKKTDTNSVGDIA